MKILNVTLAGNDKAKVPGLGFLGPLDAERNDGLELELDWEHRCIVASHPGGEGRAVLLPMECISSIAIERPIKPAPKK